MSTANREFSIGELSQQTGCNIETIRYYEKVSLLPAPPRTQGGHRIYGANHAKRLGFVRRSRELGFSLDEIRALLELADGADYDCGEVKAITLLHLQSVKEKVRDLKKLEKTLAQIARECGGGIAPTCPIIDALLGDPL